MAQNKLPNNSPLNSESPDDADYSDDNTMTMKSWCAKNGYGGVTKECVLSAFSSSKPEILKLAKREKLKGMINGISS